MYITPYKIQALQADITTLEVDAIVNAANTKLCGGYDTMTAACNAIGFCEYGDGVITEGFELPAQWVIHTVGPIYGQHNGGEEDILKSCFWQSLRLAQDKNLSTIAFPLISTGIYSYPKEKAISVSIKAIRQFFEDNSHTSITEVSLCAFSAEDKTLLDKKL